MSIGYRLRVLPSPAELRDFIHDQGFVEKDPNIFRDFEPSGMEEFSGAMRLSGIGKLKKFT